MTKQFRIIKENLKTNKKTYGEFGVGNDKFLLECKVKELNRDNKVKAVVYYVREGK